MINAIIALDAGKHKVYGAASTFGDRIDGLYNFDPEDHHDYYPPSARVVLERQNINANTPNWQNTLDCERAGQRVAGRLRAPIIEYTAAQWKGNIKKPQHHWHLWKVLDASERALLPENTIEIIRKACEVLAKTGKVRNYSFENNNSLDAMALLCFELQRIGRGGARVK